MNKVSWLYKQRTLTEHLQTLYYLEGTAVFSGSRKSLREAPDVFHSSTVVEGAGNQEGWV